MTKNQTIIATALLSLLIGSLATYSYVVSSVSKQVAANTQDITRIVDFINSRTAPANTTK